MIDESSNGTLYKREHKRVAPKELVPFVEGDVLSIGPYDVLVGFVKSQGKTNSIDDFLNKREIDVALEEKLLNKKHNNSPLDIILKERVEEKDILEFADIKPNKPIFIEDAFDEIGEESNSAYTTHITPPTFAQEELAQKENRQAEDEGLLQSIFSKKLGIGLKHLTKEQQIEVVSQLAQTLLVALEGVENLSNNMQTIESRLEKPNLKVEIKKPKEAKSLLKEGIYGATPVTLSQMLQQKLDTIALKQTALYEATKSECEALEHEFAPNTLSQEFKTSGVLSLIAEEKRNWRAYVSKYSHLNEITASKGFQASLFKAYQRVMESFALARCKRA